MAKKLYLTVTIVLTLALIGMIVGNVYISREISALLISAGSEASSLGEKWAAIQSTRWSTIFFAGVCLLVVSLIVLKIGPEKKAAKGISQKEAGKIAEDLLKDYKEKGIYVEARDDEDEDDIVTEMEIPKLKSVRFEGDKVVVEWYPVPKATGYYVWRKRENEEWCKIKKIKKAVCKYKDLDIEEKKQYAYAVKSYYETDGTRIISKKDPLGMDIYVSKVKKTVESEEA